MDGFKRTRRTELKEMVRPPVLYGLTIGPKVNRTLFARHHVVAPHQNKLAGSASTKLCCNVGKC
jgi:hypothetical protein